MSDCRTCPACESPFSLFPRTLVLTRPSFLNDAGRVAAINYEPSDGLSLPVSCPFAFPLIFPADDIVRARVRTLGVEEHHFTMESGMYLVLICSCIPPSQCCARHPRAHPPRLRPALHSTCAPS